MQTEEFLKKVRIRSGLKTNEEAARAVEAVFGTLRARISHAGGDNVSEQLPRKLKDMWESGIVEHIARSLVGVDRMDLHEFLGRVHTAAHLANIDEAEVVTRAVFMTLREQITRGAGMAIAEQLPEDIRSFWLQSVAPEDREVVTGRYGTESIGPSAASIFRSDEQIREEVEELLDVSDELDAEKIDVHVQQGTVVLRGVVRTSYEWEAAKHIVFKALGVKEVKNELTVVEAM